MLPGSCFRGKGRIHALKYLYGLADACERRGAHLYESTHVEDIGKGKVQTEGGYTIKCGTIAVTTHAAIKGSNIFTKQAPYRTYVIAGRVPKGSVPDALLWDTEEPYHYVRLQPWNEKEDLLIIGGSDHKTGQIGREEYGQRYEELKAWAAKFFPELRKTDFQWSGQVIEPFDGLAFIGRVPYRGYDVYMATGFSGNGITYGTISGMLIGDLAAGRGNPWAEIYRPGRKTASAFKELVCENLNVAKRFGADWVGAGDIEKAEDLEPGEGGILKQGLQKLAVYRAEDDHFEVHSAVCTHLGCIVQWNSAEKTFDCPCHGSRFDPKGEVKTGPAKKPLKKARLKESPSGFAAKEK